ncbi:pantoate--beta-alanine ligase [Sulfurimonas sp. HSL-1716]|uniref:pantoate--beta-alanine ligase n=1 Tax=Hydrocurvibacter sulfurireducens TaxID=3131937 RepID=UPI0031FA0F4D
MRVFQSPAELKNELRSLDGSIGFVPTMGALHNGHISLIKKAKEQNDIVVVSIFVNPTQFLKGEDLEKYPRRQDADKRVCELAGVDYLFYPDANDIYEKDEVSLCAPNVRGYILEGSSRPGHFSGVLTVVMKLLNIVRPANAYFGKKDAQQLNLITLMAKQMFMDVNIVPVDTMRDAFGLALSSRNDYLSAQEREEALKIPASLKKATSMIMSGICESDRIIEQMRAILSPLEISYVAVVDREFKPLQRVEPGNTIILVEAVSGTTRLLDNIWL